MFVRLIAVSIVASMAAITPSFPDALAAGADGGSLHTPAPFLKRVAPAVINISASQGSAGNGTAAEDLLMQLFLNSPNARFPEEQTTGSGVTIDAQSNAMAAIYSCCFSEPYVGPIDDN